MSKFLAKLWKRWLRIAEIVGNVQMYLILTIVYWTMLAVVAVPIRFLDDPLSIRRPDRAGWIPRQIPASILESMKKQG